MVKSSRHTARLNSLPDGFRPGSGGSGLFAKYASSHAAVASSMQSEGFVGIAREVSLSDMRAVPSLFMCSGPIGLI
jgi:hypothetical protein